MALAGKRATMSATYLVDGYNLLHAMGILGGRVGPHGLEKARGRLLGMLHAIFGPESSAVTIVFDAAGALPGADPKQVYRGLHVLFAVGRQEADDVIERLIRQASAPKTLHVVSDDHRVQRAARRRQCVPLGCETFLTKLDRLRQARQKQQEVPEKKESLTEADTRHWLEEFGDLEKDPTLRSAFEGFDFEEE
jgi:predicted RNA-binding protein with PIN domain